jgi:hypothetical protein
MSDVRFAMHGHCTPVRGRPQARVAARKCASVVSRGWSIVASDIGVSPTMADGDPLTGLDLSDW